MPIIPFPRRVLRAANWQHTGARPLLQRSAFTGRTAELADFGPAPRWTAEAEPVPMRLGEERAHQFAGFEAAARVPGNSFRLPINPRPQYAASTNIVANPDLANDASGWVLPANVARIADAWPSPIDWVFRADPGSARSIEANSGGSWPAAAGSTIFVETWAFRSDTGVTCNVALQWLNASMGVISTGTLVVAPAAGTLTKVRGSLVAPALTAFVRIRYDVGAFGSGYLGVVGLRVSLLPTVAAVSGAANAGRSLALAGLGPDLLHLRAGQHLTVPLPGGDEQMIPLAADLIANGSGAATASLATPLRRTPAAAATVELNEPWALMRAIHTPGFQRRPGDIVNFSLQCEEAF